MDPIRILINHTYSLEKYILISHMALQSPINLLSKQIIPEHELTEMKKKLQMSDADPWLITTNLHSLTECSRSHINIHFTKPTTRNNCSITIPIFHIYFTLIFSTPLVNIYRSFTPHKSPVLGFDPFKSIDTMGHDQEFNCGDLYTII